MTYEGGSLRGPKTLASMTGGLSAPHGAVVLCTAWLAVGGGCTAEPAPTEVVTTEWDDIGVAADCEGTDESTNCLEPHENTLRVDDEVRFGWMAANFDPETSTLRVRLAPGAELDERIREGTILYRGRRDRRPLMHRVTRLAIDGERVEMELEQVDVRAAFRRGRIRARVPARGRRAAPPMGAATEPLRETLGADCSGTLVDEVLVAPLFPGIPEGRATVELTECNFELSFWVDVVLRWDTLLTNLDKFEITVGGSLDASLHAALDLEIDQYFEWSRRVAGFPAIPIVIGGLTITLEPSLHAGYSIDAAATVQVEAGFDYTGSIEEGFGWSDANDWYTIDNRESTFTPFGPNVYFDGNVRARVWLEPRVDVQAFGIIGGFVTLEAFAQADLESTAELVGGEYEGEVCASLDVGLQPGLGASADILGATLFEEEIELNPLTFHLVSDQCLAWSGPAPTDCGDGSSCCVDGECPAPTFDNVTVSCDPGVDNGDGTFQYRCENHYPEGFCLDADDCADGVATTDDDCIDNACVNAPNDIDLLSPSEALDCPRGEDCCYTSSDCADGNIATVDRCEKDGFDAGPEVLGVCVHDRVDDTGRF